MQERNIFIETSIDEKPLINGWYTISMVKELLTDSSKAYYYYNNWILPDNFKGWTIVSWLKPTTVNEILEERWVSVDIQPDCIVMSVLVAKENGMVCEMLYREGLFLYRQGNGEFLDQTNQIKFYQPLPKNPVSKT